MINIKETIDGLKSYSFKTKVILDATKLLEGLLEEKALQQSHWEINPDGYYPYCALCGEEPRGGYMTPHCPNCGAEMLNKYDTHNK